MFVAGAWVGAISGETFTAESPATGETLAEVPRGSRDDARRAVDAANEAADGWARLTAFERAAFMHGVGDEVEQRRDELVHTLTLDQGKPLHELARRGRGARRVLAQRRRGREAARGEAGELVHLCGCEEKETGR